MGNTRKGLAVSKLPLDDYADGKRIEFVTEVGGIQIASVGWSRSHS